MEASSGPDDWALNASRLPLAFAQVREDPRLDVELVAMLPTNPVIVMVASGGETVVQVARCRPARLHLVDMNPAQLAITQLKLSLASKCSASESRALLGHDFMEPSVRQSELERRLDQMGLKRNVFGAIELIAEWGPDFSGRYERTFAELQRELSPVRPEILAILNSTDQSVVSGGLLDPETESGQMLDSAFRKVLSLENLVCLFGKDATQNPRRAFAEHFAWRTRLSMSRPDRNKNPFLWQLLLGQFPTHSAYDWLLQATAETSPPVAELIQHCGRMVEFLRTLPAGCADLVHLSNILDWLSPEDATETLVCTYRVLKAGGHVILRQLNSTLNIPDLDSPILWNQALGARMVHEDRSFFYPNIHVGIRE